jgi:hypothetical protein
MECEILLALLVNMAAWACGTAFGHGIELRLEESLDGLALVVHLHLVVAVRSVRTACATPSLRFSTTIPQRS